MRKIVALLVFFGVLTMFLLPMILFAQTNAIGVFDGNGHLVYTVSLSAQIVSAIISVLMVLAGIATALKYVLWLLPTPQPGTKMSWLVKIVKFFAAVTPEKHQADVPVSAPTPNGINPPPQGGVQPATNIRP